MDSEAYRDIAIYIERYYYIIASAFVHFMCVLLRVPAFMCECYS